MRKQVWLLCAAIVATLPALAQQPATSPAGSAAQHSTPPAASDEVAPPEHPITADQVHEMMSLMGLANLQKQMMGAMVPYLRQSLPPYMPEDVIQDFQTSLLGSDMDSLVVNAYQKRLSTEDGVAIIAFYKTPAGRHAIAATPVVMKDLQSQGARIGQTVMMEVLERHRSEIEAAQQKYEQEHPSTPPQN